MTRWRSIGIGVLVALGIDTVAKILFFGGTALDIDGFYSIFHFASMHWPIAAGLAGGTVAGYLSTSGIKSGCWHGLLAGTIGGISIAIVTLMITLVLARPSVGDLSIVFIGTYGLFITMYSLLITIPSAIAGGIGATVHG